MITENNIQFKIAASDAEFDSGKKLFLEYAGSLAFNLCFQHFDEELKSIRDKYSAPIGSLLLAFDGGEAIGCVGVRFLEEGIAELKRMYVQPSQRGKHIGKELMVSIMDIARELRYKKIRLDTINTMIPAIDTYRKAGFYDITSYYHNPLQGIIHMEKQL